MTRRQQQQQRRNECIFKKKRIGGKEFGIWNYLCWEEEEEGRKEELKEWHQPHPPTTTDGCRSHR